MRTMLKGLVGLLTVIAVITAGSGYLWAQPVPGSANTLLKLTFSATATVQGDSNGGDPVEKITVSTVKINNAWILSKLQTALDTTFLSKAALYYSPGDGTFMVCNDTLCADNTDVSTYFQIEFDTGSTGGVWSGQINNNTAQESYVGYYSMFIAFDDTVSQITLGGRAKETLSVSAVNAKTSKQTVTDSISLTGYGDGTINGVTASFTGTISASGKSTIDVSGAAFKKQPKGRPTAK
jgi:hypothetical protein